MATQLWKILFLVSFVGVVCACRGPIEQANTKEFAAAFSFIANKQTTSGEIQTRLGPPHEQFEKGRIWIYWVAMDENNVPHTRTRFDRQPRFNLVLVFDADRILERHSLLQVR